MLKKTAAIATFAIALAVALPVSAAPMMGWGTTGEADDHTAAEEAAGKVVWEKIQAKQISCAALTDEDFGALGEYFMGLMMGDAHAAMNAMMERAHGEEGEEAMHVVMGKRMSGCNPNAAFASDQGFGPMMMSWGGSAGGNGGSFGATSPFDGFPMMGGRAYGWMGFLSPIMFVWWALVIIGIVSLFRWLLGKDRRGGNAIAILEERLARGEITREEFAEMRKLVSSS